MITKNIFRIIGIALFFFLIGYLLTYPYELSYDGSDATILIEDSYGSKSFDELINREEFKGKVLYIRVWEPFETEYKPYTKQEQEMLKSQIDSLKENSNEFRMLGCRHQSAPIKEQLDALEIISEKYKNSDVEFVYIADPDNDFPSRKDDFRKWKMAVKKHETTGYHLIMNPILAKQIRQHLKKISYSGALPFYFLVNKQGVIDYQAPWPLDTTLLYSEINQLLAN